MAIKLTFTRRVRWVELHAPGGPPARLRVDEFPREYGVTVPLYAGDRLVGHVYRYRPVKHKGGWCLAFDVPRSVRVVRSNQAPPRPNPFAGGPHTPDRRTA